MAASMLQPLFQQAVAMHRAGRAGEAEQALRQIVAASQAHADAWGLLGVISLQKGHYHVAEEFVGKAIAAQPRVSLHHANLAIALAAMGRFDEAVASYRHALKLKPNDAIVHNNLSDTLRRMGRLEEAERSARAALSRRPDYPEAFANLGNALSLQGQHDRAIGYFHAALRLNPGLAHVHVNIATSLSAQHSFDAAEAACHTALRLLPGCAEARYCHSLIQLVRGRLVEGFALFEARLQMPNAPRPPWPGPAWTDQPIDGRRILVYAEEGHGDTIQFCRYLPLLAARASVTVQVPTPLLRLLTGLTGVDRVIDQLPADLEFDLQCPLMSLPLRLGTIEPIPAATPYLAADPAAITAWRARLVEHPGLKVGLAWAGNPRYANDRQRSIRPERLKRLADLPGVMLVSLQKGGPAAPDGLRLLDWTEELRDFADTAALITALDLVITVDTAVAHLAGALGKPVWLLNRFDTDWRWQLDRPDSPWYPTMRQFRQPVLGDWNTVLDQVRTSLEQLT